MGVQLIPLSLPFEYIETFATRTRNGTWQKLDDNLSPKHICFTHWLSIVFQSQLFHQVILSFWTAISRKTIKMRSKKKVSIQTNAQTCLVCRLKCLHYLFNFSLLLIFFFFFTFFLFLSPAIHVIRLTKTGAKCIQFNCSISLTDDGRSCPAWLACWQPAALSFWFLVVFIPANQMDPRFRRLSSSSSQIIAADRHFVFLLKDLLSPGLVWCPSLPLVMCMCVSSLFPTVFFQFFHHFIKCAYCQQTTTKQLHANFCFKCWHFRSFLKSFPFLTHIH